MAPNSPHAGSFSRRDFIALAGLAALAPSLTSFGNDPKVRGKYPIGLELYSVRDELAKDLPGTLRTVAKMGYEVVEFYAPYFEWTAEKAKDVRRQMDDLGLRCLSTHNHIEAFTPGAGLDHAVELSHILGVKYVVMASAPKEAQGLDGWKRLCDQLSRAADQLRPHGLHGGYHNHQPEWQKIDGERRIMDIIAANTPSDFALQLDVGTCVQVGADPVAWIKANPGRLRMVHLKDWAPGEAKENKEYRVLFGEGVAPWKEIVAALESTGGVEFYLLEQEGSRYSQFETAQRCLENWKRFRAT